MKKSWLIAIYSLLSVFILSIIAIVIILASSTQSIGSKVSIVYVATEISGSVSATYKVGSSEAKNMTDSNGNTVVSFTADQPSTTSLLAPKETINLSSTDDVIFTYTFTNRGEEYYASVSYEDADASSPSKNLSIMYQNSTASSGYSEETEVITVPSEGSATYSIKISIMDRSLNSSLNGTISWVLTKEKPSVVDKRVSLSFSNNTGTGVTSSAIKYELNEDETQFKIVGAVPDASTTTTSGYVNGGLRSPIDSSNNGLMSVTNLTNSNGAEFYYFCTNPAVVGNSSYVDPGTIYWTSTADNTLETWYDIPSQKTNLYACFMTPNFTGAEVDSNNCYNGSATQIVISNSVENILYRAFYYKSTITDVVIPQSIKNIGYGTSNTSYGAFYGCSKLTKISLPNSVTSIGNKAFSNCSGLTGTLTIPNGVTSMGNSAFYYCSGLTSITIPSSVTSIGGSAFSGCSGLTSITVASGNTTYYSSGNCLIETSTKTLIQGCKNSTIPSGVTSIGYRAFYYCTGLTSITIPNSVTSIGDYAFSSCSGLTSITIPNSVTSIGNYAFSGCSGLTGTLTIPSRVTSIGNSAFYSCSGLTGTLTIPSRVTSIGNWVFRECSGLTSLTIDSGVTGIGEYAFYDCKGLTGTLTIPDSVKSVGEDAFSYCTGLTSLTIGSGMTSVNPEAFSSCKGLTSITVASGNANYYSSGNCIIERSTKTLIFGCKNSTIPSGVTSIGDWAFDGCSGLKSITIPNSVKSIGDWVFNVCGLTSITIPDSVISIGVKAFRMCRDLKSVTIPDSVTSIGRDAFSSSGLKSVTIGSGVKSIGDWAFWGCNDLTSVTFADTSKTWKIYSGSTVKVSAYSPTDTSTNATYLKSTYYSYTWTKNS